MLQDYKLGVRMLLKYPGLTIAGGLALAIAIGIGVTAAVMLGAGLLACVEPARRALRINPIDAIRDV